MKKLLKISPWRSALLLIAVALLCSCSGDDGAKSDPKKSPYDPTKPVVISAFMPEEGVIREKIIIKGSNFGNDISKVKVFFEGIRSATVIGVDNNNIYCLAPRQLPGSNEIKVIIGDQVVTSDKKFHYTAAENVSTITGKAGGSASTDGNLATATFQYINGIGALGNGEVLIFQRDNPAVRFVSVPDNSVVTVHPAFYAGKPAVSKDRTKVYAIGMNAPHVVYVYTKETAWSPMRKGQIGTVVAPGTVRAAALDENEDYLYFCDSRGNFSRFHLQTQQVELIKQIRTGTDSPNTYMVYSPLHDCFYISVATDFGIYRVDKRGEPLQDELSTVVNFAGFNGTAVRDGYLGSCGFSQPNGMTVDEDGNVYIVEGQNGYVIRKINIKEGYVSTIAGKINVSGQVDGNPIDATFNYPYDISYDGAGGFWIAEAWGTAVRKYAVE